MFTTLSREDRILACCERNQKDQLQLVCQPLRFLLPFSFLPISHPQQIRTCSSNT
jgi:hypothetical protein